MRRDVIALLRCPRTRQPLRLSAVVQEQDGDIETGELVSGDGAHRYPIRDSVPRFVPSSNYAESFGLQWNRFRTTQLDSASGTAISRDRFYSFSGWTPAELAGKLVLDVGCGTGRFAEIALAAGARVVAVDFSSAVDACHANFAGHSGLEVLQADIHELPLQTGTFDFVYCLGVLQHTPVPRRAFSGLPPMLAPGGRLVVDVYPRLKLNALWPKYWLRPVTRRVPAPKLFAMVQRATPALLGVSRGLQRVPGIGRWLRYAVPVANYDGVYPLDARQLREWAVLDTFDMLSPRYDNPQTPGEVRSWLEGAGLEDIFVERKGFVVARGTMPVMGGAGLRAHRGP